MKKKRWITRIVCVALILALLLTGWVALAEGNTTFREALDALKAAVVRLIEKASERGMNVDPDGGISGVTSAMEHMRPAGGETRDVTVSAVSSVDVGDYVDVLPELAPVEELALPDGSQILCSASAKVDGTPMVALVYVQDGHTLVTTAICDQGSWTQGGIADLAAGVLSDAVVSLGSTGYCSVAYSADGGAWVDTLKCDPDGTVQLTCIGPVMESGSPTNLCIDQFGNVVAIGATVLPEGSEDESERYPTAVSCVVDNDNGTLSYWEHKSTLTPDSYQTLSGIDYDVSSAGWGISVPDGIGHGGNMSEGTAGGTVKNYHIYLTYPRTGGAGRGVMVLGISADITANEEILIPISYTSFTALNVLPGYGVTVSGAIDGEEDGMDALVSIHGCTVEADGQTYSMACMESGYYMDGMGKPTFTNYIYTAYHPGVITGVSGGRSSHEPILAFVSDGQVYAAVANIRTDRDDSAKTGNLVSIASTSGYAAVYGLDQQYVACVYQGAGVRVKLLEQRLVVTKSTSDSFDGVALDAGAAGETIRASMSHWPEVPLSGGSEEE